MLIQVKLFYLLELTKFYCLKNEVELCPEKTILQVYKPKSKALNDDIVNPIKVNGKQIPFSELAEHVGIVRSTQSNKPTLLSRFTAHKRALAAVLHSGLALSHRANPVAGIKVHQLYATPVLFSGLAAMVFSESEIDLLDRHYCDTLRSLLRLLTGTPRSVVYFLAGSLPGRALLHQRQLLLFGMICRLDSDPLRKHALDIFHCRLIPKQSWFHQIRNLCSTYNLPHPLDFLESPMKKDQFKLFIKKKLLSYWETVLRNEALSLPSLTFFRPSFMSLSKPHPIFSSAGSSPSKVSMALIQAQMISGRYRTQRLLRHWNLKSSGSCLLTSECSGVLEDIQHILKICPGLLDVRQRLLNFTRDYCSNLPYEVSSLILSHCNPLSNKFCEFLLDCSSLPAIIKFVQETTPDSLIPFFDISRIWVFVLHRERLKKMNMWKRD